MGFIFAVFIFTTQTAFADGLTCTEIFGGNPAQAAAIKSDFYHNDKYDVDLTSKVDVKNQCSFGVCHLYAWSSVFENRSNIEISSEYLSVGHIYNSAMSALINGEISQGSKLGSNLGATSIQSMLAIRNFGLIPKSVWKGRPHFNKEPTASRLMEALEAIIARAVILRKNTPQNEMRDQINQMASEQINILLGELVGEFPQKFVYEGKEYTPYTFAAEFFPEAYKPLITANTLINNTAATGIQVKDLTQVNLSIEQIEVLAKSVLDAGQTLQLGYQHTSQFVDSARGIMSISAFSYPSLAGPLPRWVRAQNGLWQGMHAVELVGYELNPKTGKVAKWKIKNSWGEKAGDNGFYHMYADYFREYVANITFVDNGNVTLPAFYKQPIQESFNF